MDKYIFSIDFGLTNIKIVLMKIIYDDILLIGKHIIKNDIENLKNYFDKLLKDNSISKNDVEIIILTGSSSKNYENYFIDYKTLLVDEFTAIGVGGLLLTGNNQEIKEAIIVNLGTGTTFVHTDFYNHHHLGGTGLGGGTFFGLSNMILNKKYSYEELFIMAKNGNSNNVDLMIGDFCDNYTVNLTKDVTASNFFGIDKNYNNEDKIAAVLNMIIQNICLQIKLVKENYCLKNNIKYIDIILTGNLLNNDAVIDNLNYMENYTKVKYKYINDKSLSGFVTVIGAYEYYMIFLREQMLDE